MQSGRNILVITYWNYEDALIQAYTLPYLRIISDVTQNENKIHLVTLEKKEFLSNSVKINAIKKELLLKDIHWHPLKYYSFGWNAILGWGKGLLFLFYILFKNKVKYIHCWCTPAGVIGYLLSVLTGKKLIVDSFEPHAESMVENGTWKKNSIAFKLLFLFERLQSKKASYLIAAASGMQQYAENKYGVNIDVNRFFVKPACVDMNFFSKEKRKQNELMDKLQFNDKIVGVYAGKFGGIYFEREIIELFKIAYDYWGDKFRALILTSHPVDEIKKWCTECNFPLTALTITFVSHNNVPEYMGLGDFALTPVKPVPSKRYCSPIKTGEYWALGLPVIITRNISDDSTIVENSGWGYVLKDTTKSEYQNAIIAIDDILKTNSSSDIFRKITDLAVQNRSYSIARKVYACIFSPDRIQLS